MLNKVYLTLHFSEDGFSGDDLCALSDWIGYDDASLTGQHCVNYEHAKNNNKTITEFGITELF
jgi:hypothetical protein